MSAALIVELLLMLGSLYFDPECIHNTYTPVLTKSNQLTDVTRLKP